MVLMSFSKAPIIVGQSLVMRLEGNIIREVIEAEETHLQGVIGSLYRPTNYVGEVQYQEGVCPGVVIAAINLEKRCQLDLKAGFLSDLTDSRLFGVLIPFHETGWNAPPADSRWMGALDQEYPIILDDNGPGCRDRILVEDIAAAFIPAAHSPASFNLGCGHCFSAQRTKAVAAVSIFAL